MNALTNEHPGCPALGAILRDENHRMFVYLGEFKGRPMAAPLYRRDEPTLAGDVPLADDVVARISAIAPIARAAPIGKTLDAERTAECMYALQRLTETESTIAKYSVLTGEETPSFTDASIEALAGEGQGLLQTVSDKPERGGAPSSPARNKR